MVDDYIEEEYLFDNRPEKRVPMTRLRHRIAERLLAAQQNAAILTTFNEVDLTEIKRMRQQYKTRFEKVHNSKLGFMSFFVKASTEALKRFPEVNARIDGNDIVYQGYYDIGVAVSTERGLVVPIIKNADQMSYAAIEKKINDYANRARINRLDIEELSGGTFSISNGGVFGSMLSTPILNPPQSAILGMHKIEDRAIVVEGEIVIRPMMYLALSYDHRLIDGQTAVSFLLKIKELLEDPASLLLEL
jgi:2-oxoglutarate dehydrogenase E2 component (dihydrolipoamide succinyltransferase)